MKFALRVLLLLAFAVWQGGFMFYGGVVIPVSTQVIGSELQQGFVTQTVTNYLNLLGGACLAIWAVELFFLTQATRLARSIWAFLAISLLVLVMIHLQMDRLLDSSGQFVLDERQFHWCHRAYLAISTLQWLGSIGLLAATVSSWTHTERRAGWIDDHRRAS